LLKFLKAMELKDKVISLKNPLAIFVVVALTIAGLLYLNIDGVFPQVIKNKNIRKQHFSCRKTLMFKIHTE
jgi:hypothetical protein